MMSFLALALLAGPPLSDTDTSRWWATTAALSNDGMEGRDTGASGYDRAARLVAQRFAAAGLKPAGERGGWFQPVPMHQIAVERAEIRAGGAPLRFLHDATVQISPGAPATIDAPLSFRGYCRPADLADAQGKAVICWGVNRPGFPSAAERLAAVRAAGAKALLTVSDPGFAVEPPRWPFAYARTVWRKASPPKPDSLLKLTLNADALPRLLAGGGKDVRAIVAAGSAGAPLPSFDVPGGLSVRLTLREKDLVSSNVLALLPGRDPAKAGQAIVLTAHLDGYGYGEPVDGDRLYNGTLDDAAYVALLIQLAERRHGQRFARPILFAAVTGEEKGLLGSEHLVANLPIPRERIAADINLDQLRPIFPLELLTVHGLDDSTLGDDARAVATGLGIAVQNDPEPQRNLLRRTDHWNFMQAGVPAVNFVFGYRPGTESERIYRHWYRTGYHKPQDDLAQPINWKAAADFNRFFYDLVARVADRPEAPAWKPGSPLAPRH